MIQCENNCACRPVCKEVENWKKYCEDHIRLRERSVLFDSEPSCPYYINKGCVANSIVDMGKGVIHSKDGSKTIIGDSPYDPKKQKENKVWTNKSNRKDEPYKISFGEIKCDNIDIVDEQLKNARSYKIPCGHTEYSKLNNSTQDEIMAPKNWTKEKERLSGKYRTTVKPNDIDILSTALEEFGKHGIISADTMEDLLNTCDVELISLLADESTFLEKGNELLKKREALQDEANIKYDNKNIPDYDFSHTFTKTDESKEEYDFVKELEKALGFQIRMNGIRGL